LEVNQEIISYLLTLDKYFAKIDPYEILFEGELMKYIPGFQFNYFNRYCLLSKNEFKYYKNELMSVKHIFPMQAINLREIMRVERVRI
jgi:hypothetical protein